MQRRSWERHALPQVCPVALSCGRADLVCPQSAGCRLYRGEQQAGGAHPGPTAQLRDPQRATSLVPAASMAKPTMYLAVDQNTAWEAAVAGEGLGTPGSGHGGRAGDAGSGGTTCCRLQVRWAVHSRGGAIALTLCAARQLQCLPLVGWVKRHGLGHDGAGASAGVLPPAAPVCGICRTTAREWCRFFSRLVALPAVHSDKSKLWLQVHSPAGSACNRRSHQATWRRRGAPRLTP